MSGTLILVDVPEVRIVSHDNGSFDVSVTVYHEQSLLEKLFHPMSDGKVTYIIKGAFEARREES